MNERLLRYAHISRWDYSETAVCPRCRTLTNPEYLRTDRDGYVLGCSDCLVRVAPPVAVPVAVPVAERRPGLLRRLLAALRPA